MDRRQALSRILAGGAGLVVGGLTATAVTVAVRRPEVVRREFALRNLPRPPQSDAPAEAGPPELPFDTLRIV